MSIITGFILIGIAFIMGTLIHFVYFANLFLGLLLIYLGIIWYPHRMLSIQKKGNRIVFKKIIGSLFSFTEDEILLSQIKAWTYSIERKIIVLLVANHSKRIDINSNEDDWVWVNFDGIPQDKLDLLLTYLETIAMREYWDIGLGMGERINPIFIPPIV